MAIDTTYNKHQIYGILKDYHWMLKEMIRVEKQLASTDFKGVAQYGIEATLPHAQGIVGKAIENEVMRRNKKSESIVEYAKRVNFINERLDRVTDEKEKVVLNCLLDGMNIAAIGAHLRTSRKQIHIIRDTIVNILADN